MLQNKNRGCTCNEVLNPVPYFSKHSIQSRDVEAAISSTASASTPIASASTASNRTWTLTEPGLYLIYELADKHDYQNQQLTIYKGTLLVKKLVSVTTVLLLCFYKKTQHRKLSSTHINTNSTYNNLTLAQGFLTWAAPQRVKSIS